MKLYPLRLYSGSDKLFKRLDLIECLKNYAWKEICNTVQDVVIKTISKEKKYKKAKWLSEEALQIADKKKRSERQKRKGKIYPSKSRVPKKQ